ncbi:MAG: hypothetical protein RBU37_03285 [Myxococcota bacterium]|nr:hypothetical protein [Myxococcota bacterium]
MAAQSGAFRLAEEIYAQLLDERSAGQMARARHDSPAALTYFLRGGHLAELEALCREELASLSSSLPRLLELLQRSAHFERAAELARALGDWPSAIDAYSKASCHVEAAELCERIGDYARAGAFYEQRLLTSDDWRAQAGLGRVMQAFGRHAEACDALLSALSRNEAGPSERQALIERAAYSLCRQGYARAASFLFQREGMDAVFEPSSLLRDLEQRYELELASSSRFVLEGSLLGPFGEAYEARDTLSGQKVWLQLLEGDLAERQRYVQTLERLRGVELPGILEPIELDEGLRFVLFRARACVPLSTWLQGNPRPAQLERLGLQLAASLRHAHRRGVLHGALRPSCVWVDASAGVLLGGFGAGLGLSEAQTSSLMAQQELAFLAPERAIGLDWDLRADFYGLAAVLWWVAHASPPKPVSGGVWGTLLAARAEQRCSRHDELESLLSQLDWRNWEPNAHAQPQVSALTTQRFVVRAERAGLRICWDQWLQRELALLPAETASRRVCGLARVADSGILPRLYALRDGTLMLQSVELGSATTLRPFFETLPSCSSACQIRLLRALLVFLGAAEDFGIEIGFSNLARLLLAPSTMGLVIPASAELFLETDSRDSDLAWLRHAFDVLASSFEGISSALAESSGSREAWSKIVELFAHRTAFWEAMQVESLAYQAALHSDPGTAQMGRRILEQVQSR